MHNDQEFKDYMKRVVDESGAKIKGCEVYASLLSEDFMKNPQCLLELGMAIVLDKPIVVIAINGQKVPENLRKVAKIVESANGKADMKRAVRSIGKVISELKN